MKRSCGVATVSVWVTVGGWEKLMGNACHATTRPIARAIAKVLRPGFVPHVSEEGVYILQEGHDGAGPTVVGYAPLPQFAVEFVRTFDAGLFAEAYPFSMQLRLPAEVVSGSVTAALAREVLA